MEAILNDLMRRVQELESRVEEHDARLGITQDAPKPKPEDNPFVKRQRQEVEAAQQGVSPEIPRYDPGTRDEQRQPSVPVDTNDATTSTPSSVEQGGLPPQQQSPPQQLPPRPRGPRQVESQNATPEQVHREAARRVWENAQNLKEARDVRMRAKGQRPHADQGFRIQSPLGNSTGTASIVEGETFVANYESGPAEKVPPGAMHPVDSNVDNGANNTFSSQIAAFAESTTDAMEAMNVRMTNVLRRLEQIESGIEMRDHE